MTEPSVEVSQDQLTCQICLDTLKDPVTIPCGHSYCMNCIAGYWNTGEDGEACACPQCRKTFDEMPHLGRNTILAEMVEKLKTIEVPPSDEPITEADVNENGYAGAEDVPCDFCVGKKLKAVKSCLACLASYCEAHLVPHFEVARLRKHKLVAASAQLEEQICGPHDKLLEVFCRTDQSLICMQCGMEEHKGHDTVAAAIERAERQKGFERTQDIYRQQIEEREKELHVLREAMESLKYSAQVAVEDSEKMFAQLLESIEKRRSEVKELIRAQEAAELALAQTLMEELEKEMAELRKKNEELTKLSQTEDHVHFLQTFQSLCSVSGPAELPFIPIHQSKPLAELRTALGNLQDRINKFCHDDLTKLSGIASYVHLIPEPRAREEFLQYCSSFSMDLNTANNCLCLSEGLKEASNTMKVQCYPSHPERFVSAAQVLCGEGITGRCYLEVEWSGECGVGLAVAYASISRKGSGGEAKFGSGENSWCLRCSPSKYSFKHNGEKVQLQAPVAGAGPSRIGMYVDHRAGLLAFFSIGDTISLLHRMQARFTQPLYPGFLVHINSRVKLQHKSIVFHPVASLPNCG